MHKSDDVQPPKINSLIVPVPDVQEYCEDKLDGSQALKEKIDEDTIKKLVDVEKHMFMAVAPDPDITIRSSGETRPSNFLLWQTSNCSLYSIFSGCTVSRREKEKAVLTILIINVLLN